MDAQFRARETVRTAAIRPSLIQATVDTITAGIKLDNTELQARIEATEAAAKKEAKAKRDSKHKKGGVHRTVIITKGTSGDEDADKQGRTYRSLEDRRFGLALPGHQRRLVGRAGEEERFIYPDEPPLDYSFALMSNVEEILSAPEVPQTRRNSKQPRKTDDERYITSSLRLSYNVIRNFDGFINILYKILEPGPMGLCWLDLSFNSIESVDEDILPQLRNLRILYLHSNQLADMVEVSKLRSLSSLHTLTLHGNPIEQDDAYRITVLYYMPHLKSLDFFAVTKSDMANSSRMGGFYERHWAARHARLEEMAREDKEELSKDLTTKLMEKGGAIGTVDAQKSAHGPRGTARKGKDDSKSKSTMGLTESREALGTGTVTSQAEMEEEDTGEEEDEEEDLLEAILLENEFLEEEEE